MPIEFDTERIRATMLKKLSEKLCVSLEITTEMMAMSSLEVDKWIEERVATQFVFALRHTILAGRPIKKKASTTSVPVSWWDHFLDRFLPAKARRLRTRIKYKSIETHVTLYNVCPHAAVSFSGDAVPHLNFLDSIPDNVSYPEYWKIQ